VPNPLTRTFRAYAADARAAFRSAPVEVALGVLLAVTFSIATRVDEFSDETFARIAASVALAFPLVFALSVLAVRGVVRPAARWMGTAAVLAACAAFGLLCLHDDRAGDWWRWALLCGAAVLLLAMTPGIPWRARERRGGWAFGWRLALRVVGIGLYALALYAILAGAAAAVISLFELGRPDHLYTDLAGAVFFAFAPWIFVGGIHRLSAPPEEGVPDGVSRLGRWLYAPVLVIYLLILYAYAAKVAATGELPRNLVSPLVIAAGLIGLLGALLLEPVHADDEHRGVSLLVRALPALLLPLVPLALWALGARLGEYGWTEFRYVRVAAVVAIGILAVLGTMRLMRRRPPLFATIPAVFTAVLLLGAVGPWSAPALSRRDQTARLRGALADARVDPRRLGGGDTLLVDSAAYERIDGGARYLVQAHGVRALRRVLPNVPDTMHAVYGTGERLGLRRACGTSEGVRMDLPRATGVPGVLGGTVVQVQMSDVRPLELPLGAGRLRLTLAGDRVSASGAGWTAAGDLAHLPRRLQAGNAVCGVERLVTAPEATLTAADALVPLRDAQGAVRAQLLVVNAGVGGPASRKGQPAQLPGVHVRDLEGWLILPP
jgi:Domain of unknown function (DUF4153)